MEEAIVFVKNQLSVYESSMLARRVSTPADSIHASPASQDQTSACTSFMAAKNDALDPKSDTSTDQNEAKIPSELIAHCVATLLMIQVNSTLYSIIEIDLPQSPSSHSTSIKLFI